MTRVMTQRGAENMAYVRALLSEKEPSFAAALELSLLLAEAELTSLASVRATAGAGCDAVRGRAS